MHSIRTKITIMAICTMLFIIIMATISGILVITLLKYML